MRIGPDLRMALVATLGYFATLGIPQEPADLARHAGINLRLATHGALYAWAFQRQGRALNVRVEGPLIFNTPQLCRMAAVAAVGLAFLPEDHVRAELSPGRLQQALAEWCAPFVGSHLYTPAAANNQRR